MVKFSNYEEGPKVVDIFYSHRTEDGYWDEREGQIILHDQDMENDLIAEMNGSQYAVIPFPLVGGGIVDSWNIISVYDELNYEEEN